MSDLKTYLQEQKHLIDGFLETRLPPAETRPAALHEAMRYAVLAGGKRLRPILCLEAAGAVGGERDAAMLPALSLEVLHTYTLVHDDLPAMDDDDLRRGQPTTHKKFGEDVAILTGDALLTLAFEWLAECVAPAPCPPTALAAELAHAAGSRGIIAGQMEDLAAEGAAPTREMLEYIHRHKTAALFRAAVRMGGIAGGASVDALDALTTYGESLGLAFQIVDDILDETSSDEALGKPAGSDRENDKATYVKLFGIDAARTEADRLVKEAVEAAQQLPHPERLIELAEFMTARLN